MGWTDAIFGNSWPDATIRKEGTGTDRGSVHYDLNQGRRNPIPYQ